MIRPLGRVGAIALNTYRESVRARILIGLAGVALAVSLYSLVVGAYTLRNAPRVVSDIGTAAISAFGIIVAVVIGATSLHRELDQKTIFPILARPIARHAAMPKAATAARPGPTTRPGARSPISAERRRTTPA